LLFKGQNYTVGINWAAERWDDAFISGEGSSQQGSFVEAETHLITSFAVGE